MSAKARPNTDVAGRHTFEISGLASAQQPLRWLGLFAQRGLLPAAITMTRSGDRLTARIVQDELDAHHATNILEKIRAMPETEAARLAMPVE